MDDLKELIKDAYTLFSPYKLGNYIAVCSHCCLSKKGVAELQNASIRELSSDTIYEYLDAAANEQDEHLINQMRYLLPRILELLVAGVEIRHDLEIALDKLYCDNPIWLNKERDFLRRFAHRYMQQQLLSPMQGGLDNMLTTLIMFDNANLYHDNYHGNDKQPNVCKSSITKLFYLILKNAQNPNVIQDMIYLVHHQKLNAFASKTLNAMFVEFIHSEYFKQAFIAAILKNTEKDFLMEDERHLYEWAFDVFAMLDS